MKKLLTVLLLSSFIILSCNEKKEEQEVQASKRITLGDKGIGPIQSIELADSINQEMVDRGQTLYKTSCIACHKASKDFIGPTPNKILERRSPEWVMNMILNPEEMVHANKVAKDLMEEYELIPMTDLNITQEQARDILEYFRTLN